MTEETKKYIDLKVDDDDLVLDSDGLPETVWNLDSVAQDVCNAIRESGYLVAMIGERSAEKRELLIQKIIIVVENDERIIPGTVSMYEMYIQGSTGRWGLSADTYEFDQLNLIMESSNGRSYTIKPG